MMDDYKYEFVQVSYKHFKSEKEDGTGRMYILDQKSVKTPMSDKTKRGHEIRGFFRELKKFIRGN